MQEQSLVHLVQSFPNMTFDNFLILSLYVMLHYLLSRLWLIILYLYACNCIFLQRMIMIGRKHELQHVQQT